MKIRGFLTLLLIFTLTISLISADVSTSIKPIKLLIDEATGNVLETEFIVPPGNSPHTFSLTIKKTKTLFLSKAIIFVGGDIEFWADNIKNDIKDKTFYISRHSGELITSKTGIINPHVWLSPKRILKASPSLKKFLLKKFPDKASQIKRNFSIFEKKLKALSSEMEKFFSELKSKNIITYHFAWSYLLKDYNLNEVDTIEKKSGETPTIGRIIEIREKIKKFNVKFIIVEPNVPLKLIKTITEDTECKYIVLDPLAYKSTFKTYTQFIKANFESLKKGFK